MCIETLKNLLGLTEIGKPKNTQKINGTDIFNLVQEKLGYSPNMLILDKEYKTTDFGEYDRYIQYDQGNLLTYESEEMDCDNFSIALWGSIKGKRYWSGLAFGMVIASGTNPDICVGHAFNMFITNDHEIYYTEPQSNKIWKMSDDKDWHPYYIII